MLFPAFDRSAGELLPDVGPRPTGGLKHMTSCKNVSQALPCARIEPEGLADDASVYVTLSC